MLRRVVVTGLGTVTSLGLNFDDTWKNLVDGKSGIGAITLFDTSNSITKIAGQLPGDIDELAQSIISVKTG